jgi:N-acetyl-gamma-glutamyl-phosphate reductase
MKFKIFVDGQFGTTGSKIHEMLGGREELEILKIEKQEKKHP